MRRACRSEGKRRRRRNEKRDGTTSVAILQDQHALLRDPGGDHVPMHRRDVPADGIRQGRTDVQGLAAVRLLLAVPVPRRVRAPADKSDGRIRPPCSLRWSHMRPVGARLLSDKNDGVPSGESRARPRHPARMRPSA